MYLKVFEITINTSKRRVNGEPHVTVFYVVKRRYENEGKVLHGGAADLTIKEFTSPSGRRSKLTMMVGGLLSAAESIGLCYFPTGAKRIMY